MSSVDKGEDLVKKKNSHEEQNNNFNEELLRSAHSNSWADWLTHMYEQFNSG